MSQLLGNSCKNHEQSARQTDNIDQILSRGLGILFYQNGKNSEQTVPYRLIFKDIESY